MSQRHPIREAVTLAVIAFAGALLFAVLALWTTGCGEPGPRGDKGDIGLRGPQGPPGPAYELDVYLVEGGGEETAHAWCEAGDIVLGGGCSADVSDLVELAPDVVDGEVRGWKCRASGAGDSLAAFAICAEE